MITVRLLGPVEVEVDGAVLALSRTLERALLARLALDPGKAVPGPRLIDDLWGDHVPRDAVASLQSLVYRLRRSLGPAGPSIVRAGNGYALDDTVAQVDAARFDRLVAEARSVDGPGAGGEALALLRRALDLWRGPPLAGLEGIPFSPAHATRLDTARLAAVGDRIQADLADGRHRAVIGELETLVTEHPFEERFWAQLMLARYRSGSQADALRCYSRLRDLLREELGIEPSPTVADLEQAILRHDPTLVGNDPGAPRRPGVGTADEEEHPSPPSAAGSSPAASSPAPVRTDGGAESSDLSWLAAPGAPSFVGRLPELALVRHARNRVVDGERLLVLVTGEPGIGKTRLTAEVAREFDGDGDLVLHGRWDEDPLCPYQAFRQAFAHYVRRVSPAVVRGDVGPLVPVLGRIVPELLGRGSRTGSGRRSAAGEESDDDRYRVFDAVGQWIGAIAARRRLVLVLDDMHWADRSSLLLLASLLRSTDPAPVLVVATYRDTDANASGSLTETLSGIRRTARVERMTLGGLTAAETRQLVEASLGRPLSDREAAGTARLQRHTGGNPFLLQEVVRHLGHGGASLEAWGDGAGGWPPLPDGLRDVVRWRLRQLSPACMVVLGAASAMGDEFDVAVAGAAVRCDDDALAAALDEAVAAGVALPRSDGRADGYRFAHAVVRQVVYDDLGPGRRASLHHRLATVLRDRYGAEAADHAVELARHFALGTSLGTGDVDEALHYLRLAADDALRQVAYEAAVDHLSHALGLVRTYRPARRRERCLLLLAMGRAGVKAGRTALADEHFLEAFTVAGRCDDPELVAEAALGYGGVLPAGAEPDPRARQLLHDALAALPVDDGATRALVLGRLAQWGHFALAAPDRRDLADEALAMARRLGHGPTLAAVLGYRYWALDGPDDTDHQVAVALEIRRLGEELDDRETVLHGLKCELHARFERGPFHRCGAVAAELAALATESKQPEYLRLRSMWDALVAGIEGRYDDAERHAAEAVAILERSGHPQRHALSVGLSLPWRWLQGRMDELRPLLERGRTGRASPGETALMAWVASEIGELEQAAALLRTLEPADPARFERNFHWWFLMVGLIRTSLNLGDREWAAALYDVTTPYADHNCRGGQATFLGAASLHLGALALLLGRDDAAVGHLEEALRRHRSMGARPFVAVTERTLAEALRSHPAHPDPARARSLDRRAGATAAALGIVVDLPSALLAEGRPRQLPVR